MGITEYYKCLKCRGHFLNEQQAKFHECRGSFKQLEPGETWLGMKNESAIPVYVGKADEPLFRPMSAEKYDPLYPDKPGPEKPEEELEHRNPYVCKQHGPWLGSQHYCWGCTDIWTGGDETKPEWLLNNERKIKSAIDRAVERTDRFLYLEQ